MSNSYDPTGNAAKPVYTLDNPPPRPWQTPEQAAEDAWRRTRESPIFSERLFGHCRPRFLERAPTRLYGIAQRFPGGACWFLYRDAQGRRRVLRPDDHDQAGIAALFDGAEGWLRRLWPAQDGGWDHERASETLLHFQACIGTVDAAALGFELPPEPWL